MMAGVSSRRLPADVKSLRLKRSYYRDEAEATIQSSQEIEKLTNNLKSSVKVEQREQGLGHILAGFFYEVESFFNSLVTTPKKSKLVEVDIEFIDHYNADPSYY